MASWATESFSSARPWNEALLDLTSRIHREFAYDPAATTTSTPVEEVFTLKRGVYQDFAHLQIACLRSLGLTAHYVSGYISNERSGGAAGDAGMVGTDASHAWPSCWGGSDGWLDVDPTNDCPAGRSMSRPAGAATTAT
ncbi:MAG: transglutaminase family protein [Planctomycetes bacterium]|nr:transglutaminase family protein [Planctomycetota bacterium]